MMDPLIFKIFLKNKHEITDLLPFLLARKPRKACPVLRDVPKLTSDSVALAGASLGAGLGSTLGAGLGAGSAGAGGAATAGPLQGALHDGLCPPQVWVAVGGQNKGGTISQGHTHAQGSRPFPH